MPLLVCTLVKAPMVGGGTARAIGELAARLRLLVAYAVLQRTPLASSTFILAAAVIDLRAGNTRGDEQPAASDTSRESERPSVRPDAGRD
jgi:hypothetical protein